MKAAIMFVTGNEEGETIFLADLLRRGGLECSLVSLDEIEVTGMHGITAKADIVLQDNLESYDILVLPGGSPAGEILGSSAVVRQLILDFHKAGKYLAGICFGVLALAEAGVLEGKKITGYKEYESKTPGSIFVGGKSVIDGNIITGQAPGSVYEFSFAILEAVGMDTTTLKDTLMWKH